MLGRALPVFGYNDLFDEISMYYWDGATDDETARQWMIDYQGADPDDSEELTLPSNMEARRPEWMIAANAGPSARLPKRLRQKLDELRKAHGALGRVSPDGNAWHFDFEVAYDYVPGIDECSRLPPLTLVPVAEALERQSLFVNRVVASHALALLFDLLGRGSIGHAGAFLNLASGQAVPIPLPRGD